MNSTPPTSCFFSPAAGAGAGDMVSIILWIVVLNYYLQEDDFAQPRPKFSTQKNCRMDRGGLIASFTLCHWDISNFRGFKPLLLRNPRWRRLKKKSEMQCRVAIGRKPSSWCRSLIRVGLLHHLQAAILIWQLQLISGWKALCIIGLLLDKKWRMCSKSFLCFVPHRARSWVLIFPTVETATRIEFSWVSTYLFYFWRW